MGLMLSLDSEDIMVDTLAMLDMDMEATATMERDLLMLMLSLDTEDTMVDTVDMPDMDMEVTVTMERDLLMLSLDFPEGMEDISVDMVDMPVALDIMVSCIVENEQEFC